MTKQEFLAFSLPYGLRISNSKESDIVIGICGNELYSVFRGHLHNTFEISDVKPILHPLSDLTKEIEHNGEKFVPIVELAKISSMVDDINKYEISTNSRFLSIYFENNQIFSYSKKYRSFTYECFGSLHMCPYQFQLFQKLIEWHFDIANLIEKCEAIDVNTLEVNPYKK